jgi:sporulation protein YqfD
MPMVFVETLVSKGVTVFDVLQKDELHLQLKVKRKYMKTVQLEAEHLCCECRIIEFVGLDNALFQLKKRYVLIYGIALLAFLTLYIPTRVLFYSVEGLTSLDSAYVLDQAEQLGLTFGTPRKSVRSEKVKNGLLQAVPELKWVGINTYGCRAVISVEERALSENKCDDTTFIQGIFATRDGIISNITVTKGTPLCKKGQAVSAGQLLVSGYTDCGLTIRGDGAEGEIQGITSRKIDAVYPMMNRRVAIDSAEKRKWSIQFGKKQIKLYIDSGNSDTKCGRIIREYKLALPGGFRLPVSLIKETVIFYNDAPEDCEICEENLSELAVRYIRESMISGEILGAHETMYKEEGLYRLTGTYLCDEMIGKLQNEGLENLGDRTNR